MEAKLAEIVRAEQEKSRATLEQIMRMVTELSKEKSDVRLYCVFIIPINYFFDIWTAIMIEKFK